MLAVFVFFNANALAQNSWVTFRDENAKFRFLYPSNWFQGTPRGANVKATIFAPKGLPRANCNIVVKNAPEFAGETKAYLNSEISRGPLQPGDWKEMIGGKWPDAKVIESKVVKVDNHAAYLAVVEVLHETVDRRTYMKSLNLFTITPGKTWYFTCLAKGDTIDESRKSYKYWEKTFYRIIGSLVFENW